MASFQGSFPEAPSGSAAERYLVFGGRTGWIGQKLVAMLQVAGKDVVVAESRLESREGLGREFDAVRPTHVLNAAGITGRPNVDWCESHKPETIRTNVIGTLNLADICTERGVHMTNFATGCIYEYEKAEVAGEAAGAGSGAGGGCAGGGGGGGGGGGSRAAPAIHTEGSGVGFTEEDPPNFAGSFYSKTKAMVEELLKSYDGIGMILTLRLRMPISDDLSPRSFVTKISKYEKVVNIPNSMTVLHDLLPAALALAAAKVSGVLNFVNPGVISHNEVLDLYTEYIDPSFTYTNFESIAEHDAILKARRSNNELDTSKLEGALAAIGHAPPVPPIREAMVGVFTRMKKDGLAQGARGAREVKKGGEAKA